MDSRSSNQYVKTGPAHTNNFRSYVLGCLAILSLCVCGLVTIALIKYIRKY